MTSGSSPHWLAGCPSSDSQSQCQDSLKGAGGPFPTANIVLFSLGCPKDLYFLVLLQRFNCTICVYPCSHRHVHIQSFFSYSLLASSNEVNVVRSEYFFEQFSWHVFQYIFFKLISIVDCVLSPTDMVSRRVSVLQADPVLRFCLQGPVSAMHQSESSDTFIYCCFSANLTAGRAGR